MLCAGGERSLVFLSLSLSIFFSAKNWSIIVSEVTHLERRKRQKSSGVYRSEMWRISER